MSLLNHKKAPRTGAPRPAMLRRLLAAMSMLALLGVFGPAEAADALRGKSLYAVTPGSTSCSNSSCHGTDPTRGKNKILNGANNPTRIQSAINSNTGGMGIYRTTLTATDVADIAAYLGNPTVSGAATAAVSPTALSFAATNVGSSSTAQTVTLSNTGSAALTISAITVSSTDFATAGGSCTAGGSVAAGASCTVLVSFRPQAAGTRTGSLSITHSATGSPSAVSLSGTGNAASATASLTPTSLSFATQVLGTTSAAQNLTLTNSGAAAMNISALTLGGTNAGDFARAGTCAVGTPVAAGASCTISISFTPAAAGARSATISVASNAGNGTVSASLSGTGSASAVPAVNPASLNFGSILVGSTSAAQSVTVSNTGTAPLTLGAIGTGGSTVFTVSGGTCANGGTVAAGTGSCTVQVSFTPAAGGAASGTLTIAHNASGSPLTVALAGTGSTPSGPIASLSPTTLAFSQVVGVASAPQAVTLSNTGTAALSLSSIALAGGAAADYTIDSSSTCTAGGSVAAGGSCSVNLVFTPSATGSRAASLSIVHNDSTHSPSTASLNGTGTATARGALSSNSNTLSFAAQSQGTTSSAKTLTLSNTGSAALTINTLSLGGANAGDYLRGSGAGACTAGTALAVGASCTVSISFAPTVASGTRTASLTAGAGTAGTVTVSLSGTAAPAAAPILSLGATSLDFGSVSVGSSSATKTTSLSNTGSAPLNLASLVASPAVFALSHDCPATLAIGASCTLSLVYTPTAAGASTGSVAIASNAASSPDSIALTGNGVAPAPAALGWIGSSNLSFPDTATGAQSSPLALTLVNGGASPAALQSFQFAGPAAAEFSLDPSSTCTAGGSLAGGSSCTLQVVFAPAAAGVRSATLAVASNATPPPAATLSGNGVSSGVPVLTLMPTAITFSSAPNQPLQPQTLVIRNDGAAPLVVSSMSSDPAVVLEYSTSIGGGTCTPPPINVAPGSSCTVVVQPTGSAVNGQIAVTSNASNTPVIVPVSGSALSNVGAAGSAGGLLVLLFAPLLRRWRRRR